MDQIVNFPMEGSYFNDVCHLSDKGSEVFVDNIMDALKHIMNSQ